MQTLILLALIGFIAQLIDGSLGMAYGVSSTTMLLAIGVAPAAASASVHLAELAKPLMACFLGGLGFYILWRFSCGRLARRTTSHVPRWFLRPLGLIAGFLDAAGGGGWGANCNADLAFKRTT
jgi:uncharacterized protein